MKALPSNYSNTSICILFKSNSLVTLAGNHSSQKERNAVRLMLTVEFVIRKDSSSTNHTIEKVLNDMFIYFRWG